MVCLTILHGGLWKVVSLCYSKEGLYYVRGIFS